MASMWCRLALHCGKQRQLPTLERRRIAPKKDAPTLFSAAQKCNTSLVLSMCVIPAFGACGIRRAFYYVCGFDQIADLFASADMCLQ